MTVHTPCTFTLIFLAKCQTFQEAPNAGLLYLLLLTSYYKATCYFAHLLLMPAMRLCSLPKRCYFNSSFAISQDNLRIISCYQNRPKWNMAARIQSINERLIMRFIISMFHVTSTSKE